MEYIKHFWNGNGSLPFTYWIIYVIGNGLLTALDRGLDAALVYDSMSGVQTLFVLVFVVFGFIYFPYTAVCVWRSSNKFGGAAVWAILAKVSVVIGILRTIAGVLGTL